MNELCDYGVNTGKPEKKVLGEATNREPSGTNMSSIID